MTLYRYMSLDSLGNIERCLKLLSENKLYFTSPMYFNDPYDSKINYADCSEQDILEIIQMSYKKAHRSASSEHCQEFAEYFKKVQPEVFEDNKLRAEEQARFEQIINDSGIVCFSEVHDDILMWSHYADSHKGVCLVFDKEAIEKDKRFSLRKVNYPPDNHLIPCKKYYQLFVLPQSYEIYELIFTTKSLHWQYEKEWRLLVSAKYIEENNVNEDDKRFFICDNTLRGVIFGWKMSPVLKDTIAKLVADKPIQLFQARRNENAYGIDVDDVGSRELKTERIN